MDELEDIRLVRSTYEPKILVLAYANNEYIGLSQESYRRLVDSRIDLSEYIL